MSWVGTLYVGSRAEGFAYHCWYRYVGHLRPYPKLDWLVRANT